MFKETVSKRFEADRFRGRVKKKHILYYDTMHAICGFPLWDETVNELAQWTSTSKN